MENEYEAQRARTIAANRARMVELGVVQVRPRRSSVLHAQSETTSSGESQARTDCSGGRTKQHSRATSLRSRWLPHGATCGLHNLLKVISGARGLATSDRCSAHARVGRPRFAPMSLDVLLLLTNELRCLQASQKLAEEARVRARAAPQRKRRVIDPALLANAPRLPVRRSHRNEVSLCPTGAHSSDIPPRSHRFRILIASVMPTCLPAVPPPCQSSAHLLAA